MMVVIPGSALIKRLIAAAKECLQKYGVKKTSVEQLTKMAGISKGSFYIFYGSKEIERLINLVLGSKSFLYRFYINWLNIAYWIFSVTLKNKHCMKNK
ncbi:TetR/AcrR family transcriptional regulator [Thermoanaerobacter mathranii]|uniref:TetR/AcrR family transcriptional regulator n=1 Tax=Thermoanaerobacter mathranii TaxID=583357 RepID=UPI003D6A3F5D